MGSNTALGTWRRSLWTASTESSPAWMYTRPTKRESLIILRHLETQGNRTGLSMRRLALDRGYYTGAVHRGWNFWGLKGIFQASNFPTVRRNMVSVLPGGGLLFLFRI